MDKFEGFCWIPTHPLQRFVSLLKHGCGFPNTRTSLAEVVNHTKISSLQLRSLFRFGVFPTFLKQNNYSMFNFLDIWTAQCYSTASWSSGAAIASNLGYLPYRSTHLNSEWTKVGLNLIPTPNTKGIFRKILFFPKHPFVGSCIAWLLQILCKNWGFHSTSAGLVLLLNFTWNFWLHFREIFEHRLSNRLGKVKVLVDWTFFMIFRWQNFGRNFLRQTVKGSIS